MVTEETKQDFFKALQEESSFVGGRKEADEILSSLVGYYRTLRKMDFDNLVKRGGQRILDKKIG